MSRTLKYHITLQLYITKSHQLCKYYNNYRKLDMDWKLNLKDMKVHFNVFMQHKVTCVYRVINSLLIISKTTQDYCYVKKRKNRSLGLDS